MLQTFYIDIDEETGLEKMSLVEFPAVERSFQTFSAQQLQFADDEKHIVWGVALLADTPIYRRDNVRGEYNVVFSKDCIEKLVLKFFKDGLINKVNLNHKTDTTGITLIESVIKDERFTIEQFKDVPDGSWIVGYKVENPEVWNEIKNGKYTGFSVEGYFYEIPETEKDEIAEFINSLL